MLKLFSDFLRKRRVGIIVMGNVGKLIGLLGLECMKF